MKNRKHLIGIIGTGNIFIHHVHAISAFSTFEITKAHDINPGLKTKVEEFGITFCENCEEILKDPKIRIVVVAVPLKQHFEVALKAILAGKHVLLEKPPTENIGQFSILEKTAKQNKVLLVTAFHASFGLEIAEFLRNIEIRKDGTHHTSFGRIKNIRIEMYDPYSNEVIPQKASVLGGSWLDSGINALSVIRRIVQKLELGSTELKKLIFSNKPIEVESEVKFRFPGGTGTIYTSWLKGLNLKKTTIIFDNAKIVLHHSDESIYLENSSMPLINCRNKNSRLTNHYIGVYNYLLWCLKHQKDNIALSEELLKHLLSVRN